MYKIPDIYYIPNWRKLYAQKDNGEAQEYILNNKYGVIIYPYIKRKVEYKIDSNQYYDIITPYGFNGPIIVECEEENKKLLIEEYKKDFTEYCRNNFIIAEYIRFSPWFKNYKDFEEYYNLRLNNKTVAIDLNVSDIINDEITSKRRNLIRNAIKKGVTVELDFDGNTIDNFYDLYQQTIKKNNIGEYYLLTKEFLKQHFELLNGNIFIANAICNNKIVSSSMFLHYNKQLHYHYSANDYDYVKLNGNSLILYTVAEWGKSNGKDYLHLGGTATSEDLMNFKLSFTKSSGLPYYIGTKIQQNDVYEKLCQATGKSDIGYFPMYRG